MSEVSEVSEAPSTRRRVALVAAAVAALVAVPARGAPDGSAGSAGSPAAAGSAGSADSTGSAGSAGADRIIRLPLDAGAPSVSAAASPAVVRLGAHFTLYVTATFGEGVEVNLREPIDLGPAFEVRRRWSEDRPTGDGRTTREWQLDVMPWEIGELHVAPIAVTFTVFGRAGQVQTNAVPMKIVGDLGDVVEDPKAMRGLAVPTGLWARDWLWIWIATAAGAAVGVIAVALRLHRRRRRQVRLVGTAIARPLRVDMTAERALERLVAIERSGALDRDADRKLGYAQMVEVIRDYLAARYRIAVHDRTSAELLARLAGVAPDDERAQLAGWLAGCDLVKYGGLRATPAEAGKVLDDARALIVTTTQLAGAAARAAKVAA